MQLRKQNRRNTAQIQTLEAMQVGVFESFSALVMCLSKLSALC